MLGLAGLAIVSKQPAGALGELRLLGGTCAYLRREGGGKKKKKKEKKKGKRKEECLYYVDFWGQCLYFFFAEK